MVFSLSQRVQPDTKARDAHFAQLADASPAYIWLLDPDGFVVHDNPSARTVRDAAKYNLDVHLRDIWPETNRASVDRAVAEAVAGRAFRFRTRFRLSGGVDIYLDAAASPVRDADGRIVRLLVKAENVTAQVESAAFLNTVIDVLPLALTVKDARTGRYILGNRAAEMLFDQPEGVSGLRPQDILPPPFAAWEAARQANPAQLQSAVHHDVTPLRERWLSAIKVATYDDDGVRHVIGLASDVTQQRRDEAALRQAVEQGRQAERARAAFLANISHELRTPLNGVVAGIDLIDAKGPQAVNPEVLRMIRASAATLERRLEDLIRMTQLDPGDEPSQIAPFDPSALLESLADRFRGEAAAKGLEIRIEPLDLPPLTGDVACLEEALGRLVENAVKFSERGRITLSAEQASVGLARFCVSDEGVGFDPALKDRLFAGFGRADDSLTRRFGGLGLGLTIAREAARRLGGEIDAAPRPDGGSCFWVEAPLVSDPAQTPPAPATPASEGLRVLAADDHPTNLRIVELMLEGLAEVTSVEDGQAAVEAAMRDRYDLILMDIQMPRLDGIGAVARIRQDEAARGLSPTPIIMLTANTQVEHVAASRAAGADRHVAKPFTAAVLMNAIQSVVRVDEAAPSTGDHD